MSALRRGTPPPRSPERQGLASAIQKLAEASDAANRVEDAHRKLSDRLFDELQPAVREAKKVVDEAREMAPELLVDAVLAGGIADDGLPIAQIALRQAEVAVEQASQARRLLEAEVTARQYGLASARQDLDRAVSAVIEADPQRQAIIAEYFRVGRRLLRLARVLRTLGVNVTRGIEAVDLGLVLRIGDIARSGSGGNASLFTPDREWAAALAALRDDPFAPLPGLPLDDDDPAGNAGARAA